MSQSASESQVEGQEPEETTGKFRIDGGSRAGTVLPPAGEIEEVSLDTLGAVLEPEALEPDSGSGLDELGSISGVFSHPPPVPGDVSELLQLPPALLRSARPHQYSAPPSPAERAVLDIEDLSLRPGNPYSASSLVPPTREPFSIGKVVALAAGVLLLGGAAWAAFTRSSDEPVVRSQARVVERAPEAPVAPPANVGQELTPAPEPEVAAVAAEPVVAPAQPSAEPSQRPQAVVPAVAVAPSAPVATSVPDEAALAKAPVAPVKAEAAIAAADEQPAPTEALQEPAAQPAEAPTTEAAVAPAAVATPEVAAPTASDAVAAPAAAVAPLEPVALPEVPTREQIVAGFENVREQLLTCAAGKHGLVKIDATIVGKGRVAIALIDGIFKGTPEGSCMARAVRTAHFPAFSQATLKVSFPVSL